LVLQRLPIQTPILNRLGQVRLLDPFASSQVSYGPCHLEDASVAAGRQTETIGDHLQQFMPLFVDRAELSDMPGSHVGIGVKAEGGEAFPLDLSGGFDAGADDLRRFAVNGVGQVTMRNPRHFNVQIDSVE
jgi:hypothetical protein